VFHGVPASLAVTRTLGVEIAVRQEIARPSTLAPHLGGGDPPATIVSLQNQRLGSKASRIAKALAAAWAVAVW